MAKKKHKKKLGPNPDPERYIRIETKEGEHFRLKRGLKKPARLNEVLSLRVERTKESMPVAKKVVTALRPFLERMDPGRLTVRISGLLIRSLQEGGRMDYGPLRKMEVQPLHPLDQLLKGQFRVEQPDGLTIRIAVPGGAVELKRKSSLITGYRLMAVLVSGDPVGEEALTTHIAESPLYPRKGPTAEDCVLSLDLPGPEVPWMVCLKVYCMEGPGVAVHPAWKGMRVVAVG